MKNPDTNRNNFGKLNIKVRATPKAAAFEKDYQVPTPATNSIALDLFNRTHTPFLTISTFTSTRDFAPLDGAATRASLPTIQNDSGSFSITLLLMHFDALLHLFDVKMRTCATQTLLPETLPLVLCRLLDQSFSSHSMDEVIERLPVRIGYVVEDTWSFNKNCEDGYDHDGWEYARAFNASVWNPHKCSLSVCRRRVWNRTTRRSLVEVAKVPSIQRRPPLPEQGAIEPKSFFLHSMLGMCCNDSGKTMTQEQKRLLGYEQQLGSEPYCCS